VEAAVTAFIAAVLILFIPVACAVGTTVHETQTRYLTEYRATHQQLNAVVIDDNPAPTTLYTPGALSRVQWTHGGRVRTDVMYSQDRPNVGETLTIWVNERGERTPPPPDPAVPALTAVTAAASVWCGAAAVAVTLLAVQRFWLNRRRHELWDSEYRSLIR
jgi:hypothetical protein